MPIFKLFIIIVNLTAIDFSLILNLLKFFIFSAKRINPLTHDKHGRKYNENVSYENINLDYIARLVDEGYPKDIVVRALGITRNDLEMACDILHEFGTKVPNKC